MPSRILFPAKALAYSLGNSYAEDLAYVIVNHVPGHVVASESSRSLSVFERAFEKRTGEAAVPGSGGVNTSVYSSQVNEQSVARSKSISLVCAREKGKKKM